ncbi:MAG: hypothetical protein K5790_10345 [Nitrosopumilus sp.]|uniref:hypothetical protein n=1 Tax=Nitrosopumilus sp. TaxID=2024843 RepID=UPI00247F058C|nr:hypothetical protein [Nitrosopumilus sp.]MCV0393669.1 hypothetical protein [Nitrosopumilus sp.]
MTNKKASQPEDELSPKSGYGLHATCKNCRTRIQAEYIKEIWTHGNHNYYDCTLAEPEEPEETITKGNRRRYTTNLCKSHNYQKNQYSKAVICDRCGDAIHERDFFTNRNIYWCRICNSKFSNIEYHKKKYHNDGKVVMDYIEYESTFEEKPKKYENKKRLWDSGGWGINRDIWVGKNRFDFHFIDYGFISKTKFAKILTTILPFETVSSMLSYGVYHAGNDRKFFMKDEEKEMIYAVRNNRVQLKFTHDGELVYISPEFNSTQKKELKEKYRNNTTNKK